MHCPPALVRLLGKESPSTWALLGFVVFLAYQNAPQGRKLRTCAISSMVLPIAYLFSSTGLWTYSLVLQAHPMINRYQAETAAIRTPGFFPRHMGYVPIDCWPGTLYNSLLSLYMLPSYRKLQVCHSTDTSLSKRIQIIYANICNQLPGVTTTHSSVRYWLQIEQRVCRSGVEVTRCAPLYCYRPLVSNSSLYILIMLFHPLLKYNVWWLPSGLQNG
jgi:hypothetical protein